MNRRETLFALTAGLFLPRALSTTTEPPPIEKLKATDNINDLPRKFNALVDRVNSVLTLTTRI